MALEETATAHVPVLLLSTVSARITLDGMTMLREHNKVLKVGRHCSSSAEASA